VTAKNLPMEVVAHALAVMGVVTALRFIESIYVSSIVGLQRQLLQNIVTTIAGTVHGLGAVALLAWVSPTISAFFLWQGLISLLTVALFAGVVYRALPPAPLPARFSGSALANIWRFAAGMMAITFLALLLTQVDKILLSRLLTLESFGYYALAWLVANALNMLTGPITTALYPRFTELVTNGDEVALRVLYHQGAQLVTVLTGAAAMVLMLFGDRVLRLWTGNPALTQHAAPLMAVLALGTLFNGLMWIPCQMQYAHGWTLLWIQGQHRCRQSPGARHSVGRSGIRRHRRGMGLGDAERGVSDVWHPFDASPVASCRKVALVPPGRSRSPGRRSGNRLRVPLGDAPRIGQVR
jgi:hypothetical protein